MSFKYVAVSKGIISYGAGKYIESFKRYLFVYIKLSNIQNINGQGFDLKYKYVLQEICFYLESSHES